MKFARPAILCMFSSTLFACTYTVRLATDPPGASIEAKRIDTPANEPFTPLVGTTPLETSIDFRAGPGNEYRIKRNGYKTVSRVLTQSDVSSLPVEGNARLLYVKLEQELYREIYALEVEYDEAAGKLTTQRRQVRSFVEDIERQGVSASKLVQFGEESGVSGLTLSPDGTRLVFSVVESGIDDSGHPVSYANIRAVNTSAGGLEQITTGHWYDIDPSFSPGGDYLYFASNRLRNNSSDILRISSSSNMGGIGVIYRQMEGLSSNPSQGANGLVSFMYQPQYGARLGNQQIWTLGGVNQYPTQLREGKMPAASPSGDRIAFVGQDNGLWVLTVNPQSLTQLTSSRDSAIQNPSWTSDGKYILYASSEGKDNTGTPNYDVWIMRADGTERRQLTTNGSYDGMPIGDKNQKWIYFVSNRGFKWGIWRMPWPSDY